MKEKLLNYSEAELLEKLSILNIPPFRAKQIWRWLWAYQPFSEMSNLPRVLRGALAEGFEEGFLEEERELVSKDGTKKYLFRLFDGNLIESVLMEYDYGKTVCISTQVGCAMGCGFCVSGQNGFERNLAVHELLAQILHINAKEGRGRNITNVVLMGTGEPLLNYDNVLKSIRLLSSEEGLHLSPRNISLSTCGIVPGIDRLAEEGLPLTLCLSLHSAIGEKRARIMPIEQKYPLSEVIPAMRRYGEATGRRVIYEYVLIDGFNMDGEDVAALRELTAGYPCHMNLIPLNDFGGALKAPGREQIVKFEAALQKAGVSASLRRSLGQDINGACGQLRAIFMKDGR